MKIIRSFSLTPFVTREIRSIISTADGTTLLSKYKIFYDGKNHSESNGCFQSLHNSTGSLEVFWRAAGVALLCIAGKPAVT